MAKVDIVITCYNKEKTIKRAIVNVKNQTLQDFLCVVVNDGSIDNSHEIILKEIENDDRFVYLELKNCGVANARNIGISLGNAPFVICLDGDDGMYPEFLETCYTAIKADRSLGIAYTDVLLSHPDGYFTVARWTDCNPDAQFKRSNQIPCCNMFRRDVFERVGGYRQRYAPEGAGAEDAELWLRFFKAGYTARKVSKEPLFIYNAYNGLTQTSEYQEVDWTAWHTKQQPFASLKIPANKIAHPILEYDQPEISVIIPVGPNHEHYLIDALDSLEAQTFKNWECIVVLDGCHFPYTEADKANGLFAGKYFETTFRKAYPYVKWLMVAQSCQESKGAGYARNFGANYAKGDYLVFLDCDDYLQPRFLELSLSALKHFNADWVYTDLYTQTIYNRRQYELKCQELDTQGLVHGVITENEDVVEFVYQYQCDEWDIDKLWRSGIGAVTGLYKKSDFELVNGFDTENNREDWDFHMRLAKAGKCGLRLPLPLFTYRLHTGIRREYKNIANNATESKKLKQKDVERIHNSYTLEELKMACTSCKKDKIVIQKARQEDLTTLEYIGKIKGGALRGITGKRYPLIRVRDTFVIEKVHPQDAQEFIRRKLFKSLPSQSAKPKVLTSTTPKKVVVKQMSHTERLQRTNEFAKRASEEARRLVELEFGENLEQDAWWQTPEDYTIAELKRVVNKNKPTSKQLQEMYDNEAMGKARKGALSFLQGKLK